MGELAKVSGPKDIMDDTNFERLGFQIIRTEFVIGLYSKFYKAKKKDGKELIVKLITWSRSVHSFTEQTF